MKRERKRPDGRIFGAILFSVLVFGAAQGVEKKEKLKVIVEPSDAQVIIGEQVQFTASLVDTQGTVIDTTFLWSVDGDFGTIDETTGLFEALEKGNGFVFATAGDLSGKAHVNVKQDTAA